MKTAKYAIVMLVLLFILVGRSRAQTPPPSGPSLLNSWSFNDTNWMSDMGNAPVAFTNLVNVTNAGDGNALLIDSTNTAFLQYNVWEPSNGPTNLTVDQGSVMVWIAPSWSSTNQGGTGPGVYSRLIEVGSYTTNASVGWWSLYLSPDGSTMYFGAQTNNGSQATFLSASVSFASNTWYNIALTYSATNISLFTNGQLVANGSGVSLYPGSGVLSNGFYVGSASDGTAQFHGKMDDLWTYNYEMDAKSVLGTFEVYSINFYGAPAPSLDRLTNAPSAPPPPALDYFTGVGFLQSGGTNSSNCVTSSNIWITNMLCTLTTNQSANYTFTIAGGSDGAHYDVFANAVLGPPSDTNYLWAWVGQGYHCNTYTVTNFPVQSAFFLAATVQDSDADGITDAYEYLITHTNPNSPSTSGDGISDLYKLLHGLPLNGIVAVPSLASISVPTCSVP